MSRMMWTVVERMTRTLLCLVSSKFQKQTGLQVEPFLFCLIICNTECATSTRISTRVRMFVFCMMWNTVERMPQAQLLPASVG